MKKCVIIGSGLGGLSCGCILAKNGYEVTVLEQGLQAGGCLQCFRRGDAVFDTGMHYIGSADRGQVLHTILHYLGVDDDIRLERLDPAGYDVISFRGEQYRLANGRENFVDSLARSFPKSRDELLRYCDLIDQVAASSPMHTLNKDADIATFAKYQTVSVGEVIDSVVSDPTLTPRCGRCLRESVHSMPVRRMSHHSMSMRLLLISTTRVVSALLGAAAR